MVKQIVDLPVEAGVYTEQTARGATGRWKDADKVRWRYGLPQKIGGWTQVGVGPFKGLVRKIWDWTTIDKRNIAALGTESKLYLYDANVLYDVTPVRRVTSLNNPFDTTISSTTVTVTDATHGAFLGDYVRFSGASAVGGITIDGEYQITAIIDTDTYEIEHTSAATSSATGGGVVSMAYDISVGKTVSTFGLGWGTGVWSQGTWGTPRISSNVRQPLRTWSLDNWGEDLIANPRGGGIYWWDRSTGQNSRAVILEDAPDRANFIIVSQRDRHLFALGCTDWFTGQFDPLLIRWCSKEDLNDWIPTSTNTAGDLRIYRGSEIVGSIRTRGEILVFTDVSVHQINYLGGNSVYGVQVAGENVSLLGPNAAIEVDYRVFFMAEADFYMYDGVLRPIPCDVRNYVYKNLTVSQKDKVFAGINREFNEIWWFYPAKDNDTYFEVDFGGVSDNPDLIFRQQDEQPPPSFDFEVNVGGANINFGAQFGFAFDLDGGFGSLTPAYPSATLNGAVVNRIFFDDATGASNDYFRLVVDGVYTKEQLFTQIQIETPSAGLRTFTSASADVWANPGGTTTEWAWLEPAFGGDDDWSSQVGQTFGVIVDGGVPAAESVYTVQLNAAGYASLSVSPTLEAYDALYRLTDASAAQVDDPTDAEYEAVFTISDALAATFGIMFEVTDLSGTQGNANDNVNGLVAYMTLAGGGMFIGKNTSGVYSALDNGASFYDTTALATPVTPTLGNTYGIRVARANDTITVYLYDALTETTQQVAQIALSASEITAFPGTAKISGFNFQRYNTTSDVDAVRLTSYRVGAGGTLTGSENWGPSSEVTRYVIYNYEEKTWSIGSMVRTAWADRSPVFEKPYASGDDMYLYVHETGVDENGSPMYAFTETYDMEIPAAGEDLMHLDQLIPDFLELDGEADIELRAKKYPQAAAYDEKGPYPVGVGTAKVSTRIRGRQVALKISSDAVGDFWRLGTMRARVRAHGKRA